MNLLYSLLLSDKGLKIYIFQALVCRITLPYSPAGFFYPNFYPMFLFDNYLLYLMFLFDNFLLYLMFLFDNFLLASAAIRPYTHWTLIFPETDLIFTLQAPSP